MLKRIVIASLNPVKIEATKLGFEKMFSDNDFLVMGKSVESGVSDQPMSDEETLKGAKNRLNKIKEKFPEFDFWVGIEGGVYKQDDKMGTFAWVVIEDKNRFGQARTGTFFLPDEIKKLVDEGKELGEADDIVFNRSNSKQENGGSGLLTGDIITRTSLYKEAVILASIPFKNSKLY